MSSCVIFGGAGFIGSHLARHLLDSGRFSHVHLADIRPSSLPLSDELTYCVADVRQPVPPDLVSPGPQWVFNLAAVHREPGHHREEYFETNLAGARNVCAYATTTGCRNVYFTSSISVYGPTAGPTDEFTPTCPSTPYGASKLAAELIHQAWQANTTGRRLVICRPGVIYGPRDPGNILRMIRAIRRGYFAYPGSSDIYKSYAYIYGFLDSVDFVLDGDLDFFLYNYVEHPTVPLRETVRMIKEFLGTSAVVLPVSRRLLQPLAHTIHAVLGSRSPIHPVRVMKAATPTHIIARALEEQGFSFRYGLMNSLLHWRARAPQDFGAGEKVAPPQPAGKLVLSHGTEQVDHTPIPGGRRRAEPAREDVPR